MGRLHTAARHLRLAARALKHGVPTTASADASRYTDAELLGRADEFNRNAERHWRKIATEPSGRAHVLNKPLSTVRDTPDILYRLGLVLQALDLGVGMTVLDFGAGSCWLSSMINRLRCRTISMDVSPTALALGEELFQSDPRHHMELGPRFIPYGGHGLAVEDGSVDRVVCFDAFHHVPNQDEVLAEFLRVLKPGGRLVMAEPGPGHSHADSSVFETEVYGVLENDLPLDALVGRARRAGFSDVHLLPYPDASALVLSADQYLQFIDGDESVFPIHRVQASLRNFHILICFKGEPGRDSRNPHMLRARIEPLAARITGRAGDEVGLRVRVQNAGDTLWLHEPRPEGGHVRLGAHLLSDDGSVRHLGFARATLPRDVPAGDSIELDLVVPAPVRTGSYQILLDMVDELVTWFEQGGSPCASVALDVTGYRDSRDPHKLAARIAKTGSWPDAPVTPGSIVSTRLRLENVGDTAWHAGPAGERGAVAVAAALLDSNGQMLALDHFRQPLPKRIDPGEALELDVSVPAPLDAGPHRLRFDLVAEGVCWFWQMGSEILELPVTGSNEVPDSTKPARLRARIERVDAPAGASVTGAADSLASVRLRITNTGNTRWLASPEARAGHVGIGGRLETADGQVVVPDFFRIQLTDDVAPGASIECKTAIGLPHGAGRYRLVLDLVDEGVTWFAAAGSPPLVLALEVQ